MRGDNLSSRKVLCDKREINGTTGTADTACSADAGCGPGTANAALCGQQTCVGDGQWWKGREHDHRNRFRVTVGACASLATGTSDTCLSGGGARSREVVCQSGKVYRYPCIIDGDGGTGNSDISRISTRHRCVQNRAADLCRAGVDQQYTDTVNGNPV